MQQIEIAHWLSMMQQIEIAHWLSKLAQINPAIIAAVVSSVIAFIGTIISARVAQHSVVSQAEIKKEELTQLAKKQSEDLQVAFTRLRAEAENARQVQLSEILKKRIESYPALYEIIALHGRNWQIEGKAWDHNWASSFLEALIDNNAKNGVFFSERLYRWYGFLRSELEELVKDLAQGRQATAAQVEKVLDIIRGPEFSAGQRFPGLGTIIKDEMGSYVTASVSATYASYPEQDRKLIDDPKLLFKVAAEKMTATGSKQLSVTKARDGEEKTHTGIARPRT